jgi:hypothetical protein
LGHEKILAPLDARLFGAVAVLAAAAIHFGLFSRSDDRLWRYGEIGVAVTGLSCAVLAFWLIARQFANFV